VGQDLQDLIKAQGGKLLVRVTGLQMYDSEHAFGRKLRGHSSDCMGKELNLALALSLIGRGFNGHPVRRLAFHRIPNRFECPDLPAACLLENCRRDKFSIRLAQVLITDFLECHAQSLAQCLALWSTRWVAAPPRLKSNPEFVPLLKSHICFISV